MERDSENRILKDRIEKLESDYRELAEICRGMQKQLLAYSQNGTDVTDNVQSMLKSVGVMMIPCHADNGSELIDGYVIIKEERHGVVEENGTVSYHGHNDFMDEVFMEAEDITELTDGLSGLMEDWYNDGLTNGGMYPHDVDSVLDRLAGLYEISPESI